MVLPAFPFFNKKVAIIIIFYSKFSESSLKLLNSINEECKSFYRPICIDNPYIRKRIVKSITVKIDLIPAMLVSFIDEENILLEGETCYQLINNINLFMINNHPSNCGCPIHIKKSGVSSIVSVIDDEAFIDGEKGTRSSNPRASNPLDSTRQDSNPRDVRKEFDQRRKVRFSERLKDETDLDDTRGRGNSSIRPHIPEGEGHEDMANSSIPATKLKKPKKSVKIKGGDMLDESAIDEMNNFEDPNIDSAIRSISGKNMNAQEKKKNVKMVAEQLAAERTEEIEAENDKLRSNGPIKFSRNSGGYDDERNDVGRNENIGNEFGDDDEIDYE